MRPAPRVAPRWTPPRETTPVLAGSRALDVVRQLKDLVDELERLFPERRFTLDGHLVGQHRRGCRSQVREATARG
jgi:hypothetical protein